MTDAKLLFWDLEMSPLRVSTWSLWPNSIPINMIEETQRIICWGARWYDKKTVTVRDERMGQLEMLTELRDTLSEADMVISWNGQSFDTRHANWAFIKAGLTPPSPYKEIDLMRVAKRRFKAASNKLDHVAQELGVGKKVDTGGFELWRGVLSGDEAAWRKMRRYQRGDVNLLVDLFEVMKPWVKFSHPVNEGEDVCRACGSAHLQRRGYAPTLQGKYPRFQCQSCGHWQQGTLRSPSTNMREIA
jgi:hypothetical protein